MNLSFRCKHIRLEGGAVVKEPIIPVTLSGTNGINLNFTAILDSGSDFVLIPSEVADAIGLEYDKQKSEIAHTYTGDLITTANSKVRVKIQKAREQGFFECVCAVLLSEKKQHENIIFGSSFFNHFKIIFDYPNNRFQIRK